MKRSSAFHSVGNVPGGSGSLITSAPMSPVFTSRFSASTTRTSMPGTGLVGEPRLTGSCSMPTQLAQIDQPVSVCHQWSITGTLRWRSAHLRVSGSERSPARNSDRNPDRSYFFINSPSGSSFFMARKAVGAVNITLTLCCDITRQKAPALGVPMGLPSYSTVVLPLNSGAYTM